jgi:hypothetical protein
LHSELRTPHFFTGYFASVAKNSPPDPQYFLVFSQIRARLNRQFARTPEELAKNWFGGPSKSWPRQDFGSKTGWRINGAGGRW